MKKFFVTVLFVILLTACEETKKEERVLTSYDSQNRIEIVSVIQSQGPPNPEKYKVLRAEYEVKDRNYEL